MKSIGLKSSSKFRGGLGFRVSIFRRMAACFFGLVQVVGSCIRLRGFLCVR